MKNFSTKLIATITVLMMILSLAACSSSRASELPYNDGKSMVPVHNSAATTAGADLGSEEMAADMSYSEDMVDPAANQGQGQDVSNIPTGNMLIRRITMSISTENFDEMVTTVRSQVAEKNAYFEDMSITGTGNEGDYKRGTFVIRVPADKLDELTASLEGCGIVTYASESTEDVTLDYVDIQSHLDALRTEQASLMELLEQAEDLDTIVQLQEYLTDVRYEIEYYESQSRTLDNLVDYATLTLNLTQVVEEEVPVEIDEVRNVTFKDKVKEAFTDSMSDLKIESKGMVIAFAGALPKLTIKLIAALIIVFSTMGVYKSLKKSKAKKKAAATASVSAKDKK